MQYIYSVALIFMFYVYFLLLAGCLLGKSAHWQQTALVVVVVLFCFGRDDLIESQKIKVLLQRFAALVCVQFAVS